MTIEAEPPVRDERVLRMELRAVLHAYWRAGAIRSLGQDVTRRYLLSFCDDDTGYGPVPKKRLDELLQELSDLGWPIDVKDERTPRVKPSVKPNRSWSNNNSKDSGDSCDVPQPSVPQRARKPASEKVTTRVGTRGELRGSPAELVGRDHETLDSALISTADLPKRVQRSRRPSN